MRNRRWLFAAGLFALFPVTAFAQDVSAGQDLLDTLGGLAPWVLPVIGITGGIKGLFAAILGELPDISIGPWTIKDGVYVSWSVAALLLVLLNTSGQLPDAPSWIANPQAWAMYQWSALALLSNIVRNWAGISVPSNETNGTA